ncbi:hypothetical protein [Frigoribacterium faeni]|uniref:DUF3168 domain-containing protein n=1 Tax=Frigoribacterium faeni TaxID=145483 RepID=A0A7W3PI07_9MICO|nr:hypothetical protein [Frigoribacterium faeni]MBA8812426.1 hypothetical protein [Frigoribacterium faeni]BFF13499.1 hypothetical protein GCM10025699_48020 [Microbacterium flavescens]GEK81857.1 hypothetical protein FFA01_01660 [Frigoribacterium faeni]
MSLDLAAEREFVRVILADLIGDDGAAYTYIPERTVLPAYLVTPNSPYLSSGQTFATATLNLEVTYVSARGGNEKVTQEVDDNISSAITALMSAGISVNGADQPQSITLNGIAYLSQTIQISFTIDL